MNAQVNYATLNTHFLTRLDGAQNLTVNGSRREEGQNATAFRSGDSAVLVTNAGTKDTVNVHYNADGSSVVTVNGEEFEFTAEETRDLAIHTGHGNDTVTVGGDSEGRGGLSIYAGNGNDTITGGNGAETIYAGNGNDTVDSRGGNDEIHGHSGNDTINAGSGNDTVDAGSGNDRVDAGGGNDQVDGGRGRDRIEGGTGNDGLDGGRGRNAVSDEGGESARPADLTPAEPSAEAANEGRIDDQGGEIDIQASARQALRDQQVASQEDEVTGGAATGGRAPTAGAGAGAGGVAGGGEAGGAAGGEAAGEAGGAEGGGGSEGAGSDVGGSGNWMLQLAKAQAKIQDFFLKEALDANEEMAALTESGAASQEKGKGTDAGRADFLRAQATFQASIQMFTTFSNITATSLKSIGEAMSSIVRKQ